MPKLWAVRVVNSHADGSKRDVVGIYVEEPTSVAPGLEVTEFDLVQVRWTAVQAALAGSLPGVLVQHIVPAAVPKG